MSKRPIYREIASKLLAINNCLQSNNAEWQERHTSYVLKLVKETAPSGSGIDCATKIDLDRSTPDRLVFHFSYHHMDECGMYDGWTEHTLTVRPSLAFDFDCRISGRDRNGIKEYLYDVYQMWLAGEVEPGA